VLRNPEDLTFVLPDQLLKSSCVPTLGALYERYVGMDLFRSWRLDGGHGQREQQSALTGVLRDAKRPLTLEAIVNVWRLRGNVWSDTTVSKRPGAYLCRFAWSVAGARGAGHSLEWRRWQRFDWDYDLSGVRQG
jgi:hypothetical protein